MAVALHAAADDGSVEQAERGEQGGGAVAFIVMGHDLTAPRLDRQPGLGAIEGLDLTFLVEREHHGMRRGIDIESDDVGELGGEGRIARPLEAAQPMRLQPMRLPDALHRAQRETHRLGHRPAGPMGRLVRRFGAGQGHHLGRFIGRDRRLAGLAGPVAQQPLDPGFSEALLPAPCRRPAEAEAVSNPLHWSPIGRGKHDTRPLDVLSRPVAVSDDRCQPFPVRSADDHTYCLSHRPGSHIARPV